MTTAEHSLSQLSCGSAVFISDLHLSDVTPLLTARFESFCHTVQSEWLIIMGDLFEGYCGDDDRSACIAVVESTLVTLHQRGVRVALMHGNRDFMMGHGFAKRCHAVLLNDPCVLNGTVLLSHGDGWCTLDTAYQAFRSASRDPAWQQRWLDMPLTARQAQIQAYRNQSKAAQMDASSHTTDVVDDVVLQAAHNLACTVVLHGHTHRPGDRMLKSGALPAIRKLVLGDWHCMDNGAITLTAARLVDGELTLFDAVGR